MLASLPPLLIWPCRVGLAHRLEDEDVVQLVKKKVKTGEEGKGRCDEGAWQRLFAYGRCFHSFHSLLGSDCSALCTIQNARSSSCKAEHERV